MSAHSFCIARYDGPFACFPFSPRDPFQLPSLVAILTRATPAVFLFFIQGVRALPSFHFWKGSKQVDSISGAKAQTLQDAIETHMN